MQTRHKLALAFAAKRAFRPWMLFRNQESGFVGDAARTDTTFGSPTDATPADDVGEAIGLQLSLSPPGDGRGIVNLLTYTEQFDNAVWTKGATTVTANAAVSSDGTTTGDLLLETTANSSHRVFQSVTVTSGAQVAWSIDVKAAGRTKCRMQIENGGSLIRATADLTAGTITPDSSSGGVLDSSAITSLGNDWYRISITGSLTGITSYFGVLYLLDATGTQSYTGDAALGMYIWGAQLNLGTLADYQPNRASLGGSDHRTGGSNLLLWTESLLHPAWAVDTTTTVTGGVSDPNGGTTAFTVTADGANSVFGQNVTGVNGVAYAAGIWIKRRTGSGTVELRVGDDVSNPVTVTADWTQVSTTDTTGSTTVRFHIVLATSGDAVDVWHPQLNLGATADTYSRNMDMIGGLLQSLTAYQATAASKPTRGRLPVGGRRNRLDSNMVVGVVAGAPGTMPPPWFSTTALTGITRTLSAAVTEDGLTCFEVRLSGTPSGAGTYDFGFVTNTQIAALTGQDWNESLYLRLAAGTLDGVSSTVIRFNEYTSGGVFVTGQSSSALTPPTSAAISTQRQDRTATLAGGGTTAAVQPLLRLNLSGAAIDLTLRIALVQIERNSTATAAQAVTNAYTIDESGIPSIPMPYYDGGDHLTTGVASFGTASLFADASQRWAVGVVLSTFLTSGTVISKCSATDANRTFQVTVFNAGSGSGTMGFYLRGDDTNSGVVVNDGGLHVGLLVWGGTTATLYMDTQAPIILPVGTAIEEAQNILIGARTESSPAGLFTGFNEIAILEDRALSAAEIAQTMAYLNRTYRGV